MKRKIIFLGGIHGVGKGTLCAKLKLKYDILHFSASKLIKWTEISPPKNKQVVNFNLTQERLIKGIEENIPQDRFVILDGHFSLLNKKGQPEIINEETFYKINPIAVAVILEDINTVSERLSKRDSITYNKEILTVMQKMELNQAKKISSYLQIPFYKIHKQINEFEKLISDLI